MSYTSVLLLLLHHTCTYGKLPTRFHYVTLLTFVTLQTADLNITLKSKRYQSTHDSTANCRIIRGFSQQDLGLVIVDLLKDFDTCDIKMTHSSRTSGRKHFVHLSRLMQSQTTGVSNLQLCIFTARALHHTLLLLYLLCLAIGRLFREEAERPLSFQGLV